MNRKSTPGSNITLITDFGTVDGYVGAMMGVFASRCPTATITSITNSIPPHDIAAAGWALANAWWTFPEGSVHVVVVDPSVGSKRRGLVVEASGHLFVGPDNGVFPWALEEISGLHVRSIENPELSPADASPTFHGRDVFAPCAAALASGFAVVDVGPSVDDPATIPKPKCEISQSGELVGGVLMADRFGNLVTTIASSAVEELYRGEFQDAVSARVNDQEVQMANTFCDVGVGESVVYLGSLYRVEVAVNQGSALERYGRDAIVKLRLAR